MGNMVLLNGRLKLRHLVLALAIQEHGSIVRAAEKLFITQPALSRGLRELEEILGVQLFERQPRGVKATLYAQAFLEHARSAIGHIHLAYEHIEELSDATRGEVSIGTYAAGGNRLLPYAITDVKAQRPNLLVRIKEGTPDRLRDSLISGDIDLIVSRMERNRKDPYLEREELYREQFCIVAGEHHPALKMEKPSLEQLLEFPWVMPIREAALRDELLDFCEHHDVDLPTTQVECSSPTMIRAMLYASDFLAITPLSVAQADPLYGIVDLPLEGVSQEIGMLWVKDRKSSPASSIMREALRNAARIYR